MSTSQHELKIHGGNREVRLRGESRRERSFRSLDLAVVRARRSSTTWAMPAARTPHTYLDGTVPFTSVCCGPWGPPIARRPCPQGEPAVCMGFGSCTVLIFSCPSPAFGLGGPFLRSAHCANPNPSSSISTLAANLSVLLHQFPAATSVI